MVNKSLRLLEYYIFVIEKDYVVVIFDLPLSVVLVVAAVSSSEILQEKTPARELKKLHFQLRAKYQQEWEEALRSCSLLFLGTPVQLVQI